MKQGLFAFVLFFFLLRPVFPQSIDEYRQRRARVQQAMDDKTLLILKSSTNPDHFLPDKNFYYLTGIAEPGQILVLTRTEEILFLPPRNIEREIWESKRLYPGKEAVEQTGIPEIKPMAEYKAVQDRLLAGTNQLIIAYAPSPDRPLPPAIEQFVKNGYGSSITLKHPDSLIAPLRLIKSEQEIAHLTRAVEITTQSLRNGILSVRPGKTEQEIRATIEFAFTLHGGTGTGFDSIVGSGPNSVILHARPSERKVKEGELVVLDVGSEYRRYTADITRTVPVSGKFTARQKQIYAIVLKAQEAAMGAIKKGATLEDLHRKAAGVIQEELVKIGLIKDKDDYVTYFMHGTCHWLGLDVHDVGSGKTPLAPGMAFTIEPGIYIAEENLGIRIEDDFLMTGDGFVHLSKNFPRTAEEIEKLMSEPRK